MHQSLPFRLLLAISCFRFLLLLFIRSLAPQHQVSNGTDANQEQDLLEWKNPPANPFAAQGPDSNRCVSYFTIRLQSISNRHSLMHYFMHKGYTTLEVDAAVGSKYKLTNLSGLTLPRLTRLSDSEYSCVFIICKHSNGPPCQVTRLYFGEKSIVKPIPGHCGTK